MTNDTDQPADGDDTSAQTKRNTPGRGVSPAASPVEASAPEEFGLVQAWWGDGKGKTTAALGMGARAVGHGYRVHVLQFMKGGADSVEAVRGEYNAIRALPGFSYENTGHMDSRTVPQMTTTSAMRAPDSSELVNSSTPPRRQPSGRRFHSMPIRRRGCTC